MMLGEACEPGAWSRIFRDEGQRRRFAEPTVEGVDYPTLGISRSWNDPHGVLHITTFAATPSRRQAPTSFRVGKLADSASVAVYLDGERYPRWRAVGADAIEIETDVGEHEFRIETRRGRTDSEPDRAAAAPASAGSAAGAMTTTETSSAGERVYQPAAPAKCSCC